MRTGPVEERGATEKAALWMGGFLLRDASPEGRLSEEKGTMAGEAPSRAQNNVEQLDMEPFL